MKISTRHRDTEVHTHTPNRTNSTEQNQKNNQQSTQQQRAHGYSSRLRSRFTWNWIWIFHPVRHMCWRCVESSESSMSCLFGWAKDHRTTERDRRCACVCLWLRASKGEARAPRANGRTEKQRELACTKDTIAGKRKGTIEHRMEGWGGERKRIRARSTDGAQKERPSVTKQTAGGRRRRGVS